MKEVTGRNFEGNAQSFRIVTRLAARSTASGGLNLTRRTLNGMLKYPWMRDNTVPDRDEKWGVYRTDGEAFDLARAGCRGVEPSLTARLMDWADDVTYAVHDVDDFFRAGLVPLDRLRLGGAELSRFASAVAAGDRVDDVGPLADALQEVLSYFPLGDPYDGSLQQRIALRRFGSQVITVFMESLSLESTAEGVRLKIDDHVARQVKALKELTWEYVVRRPSLAVLQHGQHRVIRTLYAEYLAAASGDGDPRLIPPSYQHRVSADATPAAHSHLAIDLVAGLTEASAMRLFRTLTGGGDGSVFDAAARAA